MRHRMVTFVVVAVFCAWRPSLANATAITLSAPSVTKNVGDTFSVAISIANTLGLTSFQFDLAFNPTILQELGFTDSGTDFETAATSGGGFLTGLTGFALGSPTNLLSGVADSMFTFGSGLTPGGTLLLVSFKALAPGLSPLTLSNAFLTDNGVDLSFASGGFVVESGQVCVLPSDCQSTPPSPVPEPATLTLIATGLSAIGLRRRRRQSRLF